MFDIDHPFSKARELIDYFLDENIFSPNSIFDVSEKFTSGYVFRGQAKKSWSLVPTAHRNPDALVGYTPQPPHLDTLNNGDTKEYLGMHVHAELRAVLLFLEAADRVGIKTPLNYSDVDVHRTLLESLFSDDEKDMDSVFPDQRFLPSVALAQHHGVPTRLLDWTESPFVAAYFAAERASSLSEDKESSEFVIVGLGTQLLGKVKSIKTVSAPRASNSFMRSQRGVFTLIENANKYFMENGRWPGIEDLVSAERDPKTLYTRPPLIRFSLPATEADQLMKLLFRLDISKLTLMPSLNNAAKYLEYKKSLWSKK